MVSFLKHWPFLSLGLVTVALFFGPGGLNPGVAPIMRVVAAPFWFARALQVLVDFGSWPMPLQVLLGAPLLFLPHVVADLVLAAVRRRVFRSRVAAV